MSAFHDLHFRVSPLQVASTPTTYSMHSGHGHHQPMGISSPNVQLPPAKKAKSAQTKQSLVKVRQKKSLSLLLAMPLDVQFEVKDLEANHLHH
jgi:hypothetical protein